jgi:hypothetical protein
MKVQKFDIRRNASYEDPPNALVGKVTLVGEQGSMEIVLSPATLGRIFQLILAEATATAKDNARLVERALDDAAHERLTLEMAAS